MALKLNWSGVDGVITDGNLAVMLIPEAEVKAISDITPTLLNGEKALDITYDMVPGGFQHTPGNEELTLNRLTLATELKREGKQTDTVTLQYAWNPEVSQDETQLDTALVKGAKYYIVSRAGVAHDETFAAGQVVKVIPVRCGRKADDAPETGAEFTRTVQMLPFGTVVDEHKLAE
ncbi:hypothetical protein [uncultured Gulosibacter sp.]|uniref:phage tail tube protein n=1 Tax=uncultured Gulosibacter sp. TaxID=1339167 RepID=UPI00288BF43D|nr:hypothetical protein [uncultured Gulosibacter sp.]